MMTSRKLTVDGDSASTVLDVSLRGRIFPDRPRPSGSDDEEPQQLQRELGQPTVASRLAEALWRRVPFCQFDALLPGEASILVKAYVDSLFAIQQLQRDVSDLFRVICASNLEFRDRRQLFFPFSDN